MICVRIAVLEKVSLAIGRSKTMIFHHLCSFLVDAKSPKIIDHAFFFADALHYETCTTFFLSLLLISSILHVHETLLHGKRLLSDWLSQSLSLSWVLSSMCIVLSDLLF